MTTKEIFNELISRSNERTDYISSGEGENKEYHYKHVGIVLNNDKLWYITKYISRFKHYGYINTIIGNSSSYTRKEYGKLYETKEDFEKGVMNIAKQLKKFKVTDF